MDENRCTDWVVGAAVEWLELRLDEQATPDVAARLRSGQIEETDRSVIELAAAVSFYSGDQSEAARVIVSAVHRSGSVACEWLDTALSRCRADGRNMFPLPFGGPALELLRAQVVMDAEQAVVNHLAACYDDCDIPYDPALVIRADEKAARGLPAQFDRMPVMPILVGIETSRYFYPPVPGCVRIVAMPYSLEGQAERERLRRCPGG